MSTWISALVLVAAIVAAHWGAEQLAEPLKNLQRQWGFSAAAGGAFVGVAAASPEVGINIASAVRGVGDIGLGAALGSNVLAIPLVVTVAYIASRRAVLVQGAKEGEDERERAATEGQPQRSSLKRSPPRSSKVRAKQDRSEERASGVQGGERNEKHARDIQQHFLAVGKEAVRVQALPYLGIIVLFAVLTLPAGWRGLQPLDGAILLAAYLLYLMQALLRGRKEREDVHWRRKEIVLAVGGVAALALGAYFTVRSTENLVSAFGMQKIVGGLFITAPMAALPEIFARLERYPVRTDYCRDD